MGRAKNGEAISMERQTRGERRRLTRLLREAEKKKDLATWRRAKAVLEYIRGKSVISLTEQLGVYRGPIYQWLQWYEAEGADGLRTRIAPGGIALLTTEQHQQLIRTIEAGPQSAGFSSGVWTGPMIGEWIRREFGVKYHNHHIPRLLHKLGFSVQRPRRRLARADKRRQAVWLKKTFPDIKKKQRPVGELSCLKTRRASGSMGHYTKLGHELATSQESIHMGSEKQRTSMEQ